MVASGILNTSEMSATRSVADFIAWVKKKNLELSASPETKSFARSGALLPKKFKDELYPLALFLEHEFATTQDAKVTPELGNDNFDASVSFGDGSNTLYIEITLAKDGYNESLRIEVLTRDGSVCLTGPIKVQGRRGRPDRVVKAQNEAISHDDLLRNHLSLVRDRIRAKVDRVYGKDHLLLLVIDDFLVFRTESDHRALHVLITKALSSFALDFMRLVVIGISGKLFLSYQLLS